MGPTGNHGEQGPTGDAGLRGQNGQDGALGQPGAPGRPGPIGLPGANSELDMNALGALVADLLRNEILGLQAPKCRHLKHNDSICGQCNNDNPYSETFRSDSQGKRSLNLA